MIKNQAFILKILSLSLFFPFSAGTQSAGDKQNICFFELDNTVTGDNFSKKVKSKCNESSSGSQMALRCYKPENNQSPKEAFKKMIQNSKCDALVISGHHTGNWYGEDKGTLYLKDMEAMSCDPKYRDWFSKIKALWLDGCNTVTDNWIKSSKGIVKTADSESVRVATDGTERGRLLEKGDLDWYQQVYAGSLDEYTPLSSRYLRMFPNTQIYGFNGATPEGKQRGSMSFIHNHLTQLGEAVKAEEEFQAIKSNFQRGLQAIMSKSDLCDPKKLEVWEEIGKTYTAQAVEHQDYEQAYKWGCDLILAKQVLDNPSSSEAQKALAKRILKDPQYKNNNQVLSLANKILNSHLSSSENKKNLAIAIQMAKQSVVQTLDNISKADKNMSGVHQTYSHLLFNNIYDTWNTAKKYETKDKRFFGSVKKSIQTVFVKRAPGSPPQNTLEERIRSDTIASLKKGDLLKFYTEIYDVKVKGQGSKAEFVKTQVDELLKKAKAGYSDLRSPRNKLKRESKRTLAVSVVNQLYQYDFLSKKQIQDLLNRDKLFPKNTKNPFFIDTKMKLRFALMENPSEITSIIKENKRNSMFRRSAVRTGVAISLDQFQKNPGSRVAKQNLVDIAEEFEDKEVEEVLDNKDSWAFFQALHLQMEELASGPKQADLLLSLSLNGGEKLEKLIYHYANNNLDKEAYPSYCPRLIEELRAAKRLYIQAPDYCGEYL